MSDVSTDTEVPPALQRAHGSRRRRDRVPPCLQDGARRQEGRMTVTIGRRELLAALGGAAAAWPLASRAQQADRMRGLVVLRSADVGDAKGKAQFFAFMEELAALGWADRFNLPMEIRWGGRNVNRAAVFAK